MSDAPEGPPGVGDFIAKAREVQQRMAQLQRDLAMRRVEGEAGGGMVRAVATGTLRILEVHIEPSLLASGDRDMVQDLTAAAVNSALEAAQRMIQSEMQKASAGVSFPNPFGTPGAGGAAPGDSGPGA